MAKIEYETGRSLDEALASGRLWASPNASDNRSLIVLVHGWRKSPRVFAGLMQALRDDERFTSCDLLPCLYPAGILANTDAGGVARGLASEIDRLDKMFEFESVYLIGHSMGGVIVRATYLDAAERNYSWNAKVKRLALLASTNRGFNTKRLRRRVAVWLSEYSPIPVARLGLSMCRAGTFVSSVRLRWLRRFADSEPAETVQIRGYHDVVVESNDSADLFRYDNSAEIEIDATHTSVVPKSATEPAYGFLVNALTLPIRQMKRPILEDDCKQTVFLIHGIRDRGGAWLEHLKKEVLRFDGSADVQMIEYGYFKLLDFLLPSFRANKVRRFVDEYSQALAKRPEKPISVAGHSNGTYILGNAVKNIDGVEFEKVYLAGSVLPDSFPWKELLGSKVQKIRNDAASQDWVVALICGTLSCLPIYRDLGIGGFAGFQQLPLESESRYFSGGHSVALEEENLETVAKFLAMGAPSRIEDLPTIEPSVWLDRGSRGLFWILLVMLGTVTWLTFLAPSVAIPVWIALGVVLLVFLIAW